MYKTIVTTTVMTACALGLSACGGSLTLNRAFDPRPVFAVSPSYVNSVAQPILDLHMNSDGTVVLIEATESLAEARFNEVY